jgi:hypothetical protein
LASDHSRYQRAFGADAAERQKAGRPVDVRDTRIAGIALARNATLATRNVRHFRDLKIPVIDPWKVLDR